jgi:hypothetical protein
MNRLNRQRMARAVAFALLVATFPLAGARADEPGFTPKGLSRDGERPKDHKMGFAIATPREGGPL